MKSLPSFEGHCQERPGDYQDVLQHSVRHLVPKLEDTVWWKDFMSQVGETVSFDTPLQNEDWSISPHFGYFGCRFHPIEGVPEYYHTGIDFQSAVRTPVFPITDGVLEYSGYGLHNGTYVLLSHPDVVTEDGYTMHTSYMHLRSHSVSFSSYQKMLREISLNTYPQIQVFRDTQIGELGSSGMSTDVYPHMHLQVDFRKEGKDIVAVNPISLFGIKHKKNGTAGIKTKKEFRAYFDKYRDDLSVLQSHWKSALREK